MIYTKDNGLEVKKIKNMPDAMQYVEGCLNDYENGETEKDALLIQIYELLVYVRAEAKE